MQDKVNLRAAFDSFSDHWNPRLAAELNGQHVRLAKLKGEFVWHAHENEDEMFFVVRGGLTIRLRDRNVTLNEGEFFVVPRGVEHLPIAEDEAWVMMFEPARTLNTGNVRNARTRTELDRLD
ncbi:MAG: cupin domain-containing protein [Acidobacteria bacterium]|nr:cupin domain-containing protein [Acidobacteriota bacterium]NIM63825.1 cupin domain-containing protein [Acidobacteriota bacterium]NIO59759.1 cupin domain-containing protein [Acidobacteriota bacterium]NIQ30842.1 cupin domain-containing protein [Acidobacteriota bacterium]NIQ85915.1 cupin domain-containing protein [Acidobacteriota bacterium]